MELLQQAREQYLEELALEPLVAITDHWLYPAALRALAGEYVGINYDRAVLMEDRPSMVGEDWCVCVATDEVRVRRRILDRKIAGLNEIAKLKWRPRILVWMDEWMAGESEIGAGSPKLEDANWLTGRFGQPRSNAYAASEVSRVLKDFGFVVRDRSRATFLQQEHLEHARVENDEERMRAITRDFGAQLYVDGRLVVYEAPSAPPLREFHVSFVANIYTSAAGELVGGIEPFEVIKSSIVDGDKGAIDALQQAGKDIGRRCAEALVHAYIQIAKSGRLVKVTLNHANSGASRAVKDRMNNVAAFNDVHETWADTNVTRLDVRTKFGREEVKDWMMDTHFAKYHVELRESQGDAIEFDIVAD